MEYRMSMSEKLTRTVASEDAAPAKETVEPRSDRKTSESSALRKRYNALPRDDSFLSLSRSVDSASIDVDDYNSQYGVGTLYTGTGTGLYGRIKKFSPILASRREASAVKQRGTEQDRIAMSSDQSDNKKSSVDLKSPVVGQRNKFTIPELNSVSTRKTNTYQTSVSAPNSIGRATSMQSVSRPGTAKELLNTLNVLPSNSNRPRSSLGQLFLYENLSINVHGDDFIPLASVESLGDTDQTSTIGSLNRIPLPKEYGFRRPDVLLSQFSEPKEKEKRSNLINTSVLQLQHPQQQQLMRLATPYAESGSAASSMISAYLGKRTSTSTKSPSFRGRGYSASNRRSLTGVGAQKRDSSLSDTEDDSPELQRARKESSASTGSTYAARSRSPKTTQLQLQIDVDRLEYNRRGGPNSFNFSTVSTVDSKSWNNSTNIYNDGYYYNSNNDDTKNSRSSSPSPSPSPSVSQKLQRLPFLEQIARPPRVQTPAYLYSSLAIENERNNRRESNLNFYGSIDDNDEANGNKNDVNQTVGIKVEFNPVSNDSNLPTERGKSDDTNNEVGKFRIPLKRLKSIKKKISPIESPAATPRTAYPSQYNSETNSIVAATTKEKTDLFHEFCQVVRSEGAYVLSFSRLFSLPFFVLLQTLVEN